MSMQSDDVGRKIRDAKEERVKIEGQFNEVSGRQSGRGGEKQMR